MPSFRGLTICVVPSPDDEPFPELPHPDSSSVHLRGPHFVSPNSSLACSAQSTPEKCKPTTSVYIPSIPGAQFHIRYTISRPPVAAKFLYFKMAMNGRQVVSWGIKTQIIPNQIVSHGLYEPDKKWQYREGGVTYKREGIEKRYFYFTPYFEETSAAMDGGLIDLQVFRCKGRKRRAPDLADFRSQHHYGITSPTGGLVESPQDLEYYDYSLIDPVNSPYATLRFFYRTWGHLRALNLVPEFYCDELMTPLRVLENTSPKTPDTPFQQRTEETESFGFSTLDRSVFYGDGRIVDKEGNERMRRGRRAFRLATPPELEPPLATLSRLPQPSKMARDVRLDSDPLRPLPVLPEAELFLRKPSLESIGAPSVTPSLLPYIDESSSADEIELGVARQVVLPFASKQAMGQKTLARPLPTPPILPPPSSDHDTIPRSSGGLELFRRVGRQDYSVNMGTDREQHMEGYRGCGSNMRTSDREIISVVDKFGNMSVSEVEWMQRSPSPLRRKQGRAELSMRTSRQ